MRSNKIAVTVLVLISIAFSMGIVRLFTLRFQGGDIYPRYSSLRSDPVGTKILYESLANCAGLSVSRNHEPIHKVDLSGDTVLFFLGDRMSYGEAISREAAGQINGFVRRGGRVVIALVPQRSRASFQQNPGEKGRDDESGEDDSIKDGTSGGEDEEKNGGGKDKKTCNGMSCKDKDLVAAAQWLGVEVAMVSNQVIRQASSYRAVLASAFQDSGLPLSVSCRTDVYFKVPQTGGDDDHDAAMVTTNLSVFACRSVYERAGRSVMVELTMGRGSIILSALGFFVSNEAMRSERHPALLAWLLDGRPRVVFDETHHGIMRSYNIATLARDYGLHWCFGGLLLLAGLFMWRNSISLVPYDEPGDIRMKANVTEGRGSASGLINLLKKNIPRRSLIRACLHEYRGAVNSEGDPWEAEKTRRADAILVLDASRSASAVEVVRLYNKITEILRCRNRRELDKQTEEKV